MLLASVTSSLTDEIRHHGLYAVFVLMAIDGVLPSVQSVHAKTYPYARPTFYYTNGEPAGLAKEFLQFTISGAGQKIAAQVGFVPIP